MTLQQIKTKYKIKFNNMLINDFLSIIDLPYNIDHDAECLNQLIIAGDKLNVELIEFVLMTTPDRMEKLLDFLSTEYAVFNTTKLPSDLGNGYVINFWFKNIDALKQRKSVTVRQKKLKQLIINCYRNLKKTTEV